MFKLTGVIKGFCCALSLLMMTTPQLSAAEPLPRIQYMQLAQQQITLRQAVAKVQQSYGGQVLKAEPARAQGRPIYRIRMMSDGRVREFVVDATSGELLRPRR